MKDIVRQYLVVIMFLLSKESRCRRLWKNVLFVKAGTPYQTHCDGSRVDVHSYITIYMIELYWRGKWVYRYKNGQEDKRRNAEGWEIEVSGIGLANNTHTFDVTIRFPRLTLKDQGSLLCRIFFHDWSTRDKASLEVELVNLYVQVPSEQAVCDDESVYYRLRKVCVKLIQLNRTWSDARDYCTDLEGGSLVVTQSYRFELFVAGLIIKGGGYQHWVGSFINSVDRAAWLDGLNSESQPEDKDNNKLIEDDCGFIDPVGLPDRISYGPCADSKYFLCETAAKGRQNRMEAKIDVIVFVFLGMTLISLVTVCVLMALPQGIYADVIDGIENF